MSSTVETSLVFASEARSSWSAAHSTLLGMTKKVEDFAKHARRFARDNEFDPTMIDSMITKNIGMLLLAVYLILVGIIGLLGFSFGFVTPIVALVAGILILMGK